jgi:hypothetical protein
VSPGFPIRALALCLGVAGWSATQDGRTWVLISTASASSTYLDSLSLKAIDREQLEVYSRQVYHAIRQERRGTYDNVVHQLRVDCRNARIRTLTSRYFLGEKYSFRTGTSAARRTWSRSSSTRSGLFPILQAACRWSGRPVAGEP